MRTDKVQVRVWDSTSGKEVLALPNSEGANDVCWSGDGRRLVAFSGDWLKVWTIDQGKELFTLPNKPGTAWVHADWSPDGKRLAIVHDNRQSQPLCTLDFVDAASGKELGSSPVIGAFRSLKWSPDGQRVAVLATSRFERYQTVRFGPYLLCVLDAATGNQLFQLHSEMQSVAWSSDSKRLLTQSPEDSYCLAWHGTMGEKVAPREGDLNTVVRNGFLPLTSNPIPTGSRRISPDGRRMAETAREVSDDRGEPGDIANLLRVWDTPHGKRAVPYLRTPQTQLGQCFESPDGRLLAVQEEAVVREAQTGRIVHVPGGIGGSIRGAAFSPDARWLVVTHATSKVVSIRIFSATTQKVAAWLPGVESICWSPDCSSFCYVDRAYIRIWDPNLGKEIQTLRRGGEETPRVEGNLIWSPNGKRLLERAFGVSGPRIDVWDVTSGTRLRSLTKDDPKFNADQLSWSPDGEQIVAEFGTDPRWTWNLADEQPKEIHIEVPAWIASIIRSPDGRKWATASKDQRLMVRDRGKGWKTYPVTCRPGAKLVWSPDGRQLAVGNSPDIRGAGKWELFIQDTTTDAQAAAVTIPMEGPGGPVAWNPRGERLMVYDNGRLKVFESTTGKEISSLSLLPSRVYSPYPYDWAQSVSWSPDGRHVIAVLSPPPAAPAARGRTSGPPNKFPSPPRIGPPDSGLFSACYDLTNGNGKELFKEALGASPTSPAFVKPAQWSPDGRFVLIKGFQDAVCRDVIANREVVRAPCADSTLHFPGRAVTFAGSQMTPDGGLFLTSDPKSSKVRLWMVVSGKEEFSISGPAPDQLEFALQKDCWSPDGHWLAASRGPRTTLWHVSRGEEYSERESDTPVPPTDAKAPSQPGQRVNSGADPNRIVVQAWSPDSCCLATGNRRGILKLRTVEGRGVAQAIEAHKAAIRSLLWSGDGQSLASCGEDGSVKVWKRVSGEQVVKFECAIWPNPRINPDWPFPAPKGTNLAWSPKGDRLAVAEDDGVTRIWDTGSQQAVLTLHGHSGPAALAWNPKFDRLASAVKGGIKVWDTVTGQELVSLSTPGDLRDHAFGPPVAWSADGWRLEVSGISANPAAITVWDATP
jgi:WD40 repeat protein